VVVEPDQVADPVGVGVAGDDDVVADVVFVECLEGAVAVGLIAIPGVVVEGVGVTVGNGLVET